MSMDDMIDLNKACGKELSQAEAARLREVGSRLNLREDDALWPLLAAMEYQRIYYEALPEKIAAASRTIMDSIAAAAEKETAVAQAKLTNSVVEEARNLASKIQFGKLVPMGLRTGATIRTASETAPGIPAGALKVGCLLLGLGAGLLFGFMLTRITEIQSYDTRSAVYGGSVLVFGGLGLIVSFIVERALSRRR